MCSDPVICARLGMRMLHPKSVIWLQPKLVVEIECRAWTGDRKLRYASCKGLREVQDNATVYELD
ncbi:ATP dependent DNA ligase [Rhizobium ruizarguesonis]